MLGGPLAEDRGFILHTPPSRFASSIRISDNTIITTSRDVLETPYTRTTVRSAGCAGLFIMGKGQLEQELLDNAAHCARRPQHLIQNADCRPLARCGEAYRDRYSDHAVRGGTCLMSGTLLSLILVRKVLVLLLVSALPVRPDRCPPLRRRTVRQTGV